MCRKQFVFWSERENPFEWEVGPVIGMLVWDDAKQDWRIEPVDPDD